MTHNKYIYISNKRTSSSKMTKMLSLLSLGLFDPAMNYNIIITKIFDNIKHNFYSQIYLEYSCNVLKKNVFENNEQKERENLLRITL